jgi:starch synthase (maltosyl-transferring)
MVFLSRILPSKDLQITKTQIPLGTRSRVAIEHVQPEINAGRFPIKRVVGEEILVTADVHHDGHDALRAVVQYRREGEKDWHETPMHETQDDVWEGRWIVNHVGSYEYTVVAWIDSFETWRKNMVKKMDAGIPTLNDFLEGADLIETAALLAKKTDATEMRACAALLRSDQQRRGLDSAFAKTMIDYMSRYGSREHAVTYDRILQVRVDSLEAGYGAWYEMFPRSAGYNLQRGATLREAESRLSSIAEMGFSVVYLPPIHPIGKSFRKGPNNQISANPLDPGSPWAIGSNEGGHKAVNPALGTLDDFDHFVQTANQHRLHVALDLAYQCSPDHPYIQEHPDWFRHRPDGSVHYAENPPKLYQDIVPFDFECQDSEHLWLELKSIVEFWISHGVNIFRADNPHTKPYRFWEWLIAEIQKEHPGTLFLAEAFTRPKIMRYLAKCGFTQSYSYFTWRNSKQELTDYLTELTQTSAADYFRPNFFTNTPDILPAYLQEGGRPAHAVRLILAATLSANYGIYGPAFELCESQGLLGTEDYEDSEKYQIRVWDWNKLGSIKELVTQVNRIRHENLALHSNRGLRFYPSNSDTLLCYSRSTADASNILFVVVNLDPHQAQEGWVHFSGSDIGLKDEALLDMHDLLSDTHYRWVHPANYVRLDPFVSPAHIFRVRPFQESLTA